MSYEITIADVDAYLATKQEADEIGITCTAKDCLLSRAMQWKYPGHTIEIALGEVGIDGLWQRLSYEMWMFYWDFDSLNQGLIERSVTKREWLEAQVRP